MSPERIKALRNREGFNQPQFAALLGVETRTVQRWERGAIGPKRPLRILLEMIDAGELPDRYRARALEATR